MAAVVREAIDRGLPGMPARRAAALSSILAASPMEVGSPDDLRAELDELRGRRG